MKKMVSLKSPRFSLLGWNVWKFLKGNVRTLKELAKVSVPLLAGMFASDNAAVITVITVVGKAAFDILEYFVKEY